jgi:hypothetical protein
MMKRSQKVDDFTSMQIDEPIEVPELVLEAPVIALQVPELEAPVEDVQDAQV